MFDHKWEHSKSLMRRKPKPDTIGRMVQIVKAKAINNRKNYKKSETHENDDVKTTDDGGSSQLFSQAYGHCFANLWSKFLNYYGQTRHKSEISCLYNRLTWFSHHQSNDILFVKWIMTTTGLSPRFWLSNSIVQLFHLNYIVIGMILNRALDMVHFLLFFLNFFLHIFFAYLKRIT